MTTKRTKKSTRKVKNLKAKSLSADKAKRVKGGAPDIFWKIGDIKSET